MNQINNTKLRKFLDETWDDVLQTLETSYVQGAPIVHWPDNSLEHLKQLATKAENYLKEVDKLTQEELSIEERTSLESAKFELELIAERYKYDDYIFDITPYNANLFPILLPLLKAGADIQSEEGRDKYLHSISSIGEALTTIKHKLERQLSKGITMSKDALPGSIASLNSLKQRIHSAIFISLEDSDVSDTEKHQFKEKFKTTFSLQVSSKLDEIINYLQSEPYQSQLKDDVGLWQYEGGKAAYQYLIKKNCSREVTPEEIFEDGEKRLAEVQQKMAQLREKLNFDGNFTEFNEYIRNSGDYVFANHSELEESFINHLKAIESGFNDFFEEPPLPGYSVSRLPEEVEKSVTFGYFQIPTVSEPYGTFFYNGLNLDQKPNLTNAALIYHELVPGHHYHLANQVQNDSLHPSRRFAFQVAFNEGWAEYASDLAKELGGYQNDFDLYGRYLNEAMFCIRQVVDTGMNYFGWSLEKARDFMAKNSLLSEGEIASETLRFSTDIPAQALAFGTSYQVFKSLRAETEQSLGESFDIKAFHKIVLSSGGIPLRALEQKIKRYCQGSLAL